MLSVNTIYSIYSVKTLQSKEKSNGISVASCRFYQLRLDSKENLIRQEAKDSA